jgi:iron complex transport system permease protein
MYFSKKEQLLFGILGIIFIFFLALNISLGSVSIPIFEVLKGLLGGKMEKESWEIILWNFRLPKAITAIFTGIALSISGLMMQTLFRNPLAGPYVLGLSSGASLGVACVILGAGLFPSFLQYFLESNFGIVLASSLGSFLVFLTVILVSQKMKDTLSILIIGLMFGSFTSALVSVLSYFTTAEKLQKFTFWSMGSISNLSWNEVTLLGGFTLLGITLSFLIIKPLDALLLGEKYAKSIGVNYKKTKNTIVIATSILAGSSTAFVGPIAFIGLAVPHIAKIVFQTNRHHILFFSTLLIGSITMLLCDTIAQVPGYELTLPINAVTSIVGAPLVIWLIVRKKQF